MSESIPRRGFQIHLSTAIVLMFASGGLFWINAITRLEVIQKLNSIDYSCFVVRGFPMVAFARYGGFLPIERNDDRDRPPSEITKNIRESFDDSMDVDYFDARGWSVIPREVTWEYSLKGIVANCSIGILFLLLIAIGLEYLIRRHEARKSFG